MNEWDRKILASLYDDGGLTTGHVAHCVLPQFGHNKRTHSAFIRSKLLRLEQAGLVRKLDDQKPVCWVKSRPSLADEGEKV